ncbi:CTNS protein [Geosmithia morbida]|uniref:CTNS protein n=1 Tax=Geosmithia morbida TaxID=1094350 RepID=A0A9P4YY64_9HYPO|nr:CTNS protein [Geosmithia morbida]KAF4124662.1 CTNS protein [Geosmithia morbida]
MASFVAQVVVAATAETHSPSVSLALSGIFGSISLVAWICVILPQLVTNFKAQNADGLSMAFLIVWLLGDVTNLLGAFFTHLAPTAIALPCYFCLADFALISQVIYYNSRNKAKAIASAASAASASASAAAGSQIIDAGELSEDSPLLRRQESGPPTSNNGTVAAVSAGDAGKDLFPPAGGAVSQGQQQPRKNSLSSNALSLLSVYLVGAAGWFVSYKAGAWDSADPGTPDGPDEADNPLEMAGLTLGYISAVCYLCARVPQIIKNHREKSCEGLALLFFMLSLTGNLTYGISLLAYSQDRKYLLNALPFLLGSIGTITEDCIIFVQFRLYGDNARPHISSA